MKETYFDNIGKRMPYTTPESFFDKLEDNIWQEVKKDFQEKDDDRTVASKRLQIGHKSVKLKIVLRSAIAIAASIVLAFIVNLNFSESDDASFNDVDQAFSQLSTDDQDNLLNFYQNDIFING